MRTTDQRGFSLIELLLSLAVLVLVMSGVYGMLIQNARINKSQQMASEAQANARSCLQIVVQKLRTAGWDPTNAGFAGLVLDPDTSDDVSQIEVYSDLNADGDTAEEGEQVIIRHVDGRVEWRPTGNPQEGFIVLAINISNDADGDGNIEPMFQPDVTPNPTRITVQITAESPIPDPSTGEPVRYTLTSDVAIRNET